MNCEAFRAALGHFARQALDSAKRLEFEAHRNGCEACQRLFDGAQSMKCSDFVDFLNAYVEDDLAPEPRRVFEGHIRLCADCERFLESYRQTMKLEQLLCEDGDCPPPEIPDEIVRAILAARVSPPSENGG